MTSSESLCTESQLGKSVQSVFSTKIGDGRTVIVYCFHPDQNKDVSAPFTNLPHVPDRVMYLVVIEDAIGEGRILPKEDKVKDRPTRLPDCDEATKAALLLICEEYSLSIYSQKIVKAMTRPKRTNIYEFKVPDKPELGIPSADISSKDKGFLNTLFCLPSFNNRNQFEGDRKKVLRVAKTLSTKQVPKLDVCIEVRDMKGKIGSGFTIEMTHDEVMAMRKRLAAEHASDCDKMFAFCMGLHRRLGTASIARVLSEDSLRSIMFGTGGVGGAVFMPGALYQLN